MKNPRLSSGRPFWSARLGALAVIGIVSVSCREAPSAGVPTQNVGSAPVGVSGLGRIEPGEGVVRVAARAPGGAPIVGRLLVRKGQAVKVGQVVAELDNKDELEAAVQQAISRTEVARRRLAQSRAGAEASQVSAQNADIERLQRDLENARIQHKRYQSLGKNVTAEELDRLKLRVDSAESALTVARQQLASLTEVRAVDVEVAQAELEEALQNETRARADAKTSVIHSPIDGRVVEIQAWPGEQVGPDGLMELAPTEPMYAVAEITESDIARVRVGQRATITGDALLKPVQGTVERISPKVLQNQTMPASPARFSDARVVEVWIKVDDSRAVGDLIHLRVDVVIQP
jgi:HlyD family secretion protein